MKMLHDLMDRLRNLFRRKPREYPVHWMLSESDGPAQYIFPHPVTQAEALKFLRDNYQRAIIDYIDFNASLIFYRIKR